MAVKRQGAAFIWMLIIAGIGLTVVTMTAWMSDSVIMEKEHYEHSTRATTHARGTGAQLQDWIAADTVNWTFYQTSYSMGQRAGGTGQPWESGTIPTEDTVAANLANQFRSDLKATFGSFTESICAVFPGRFNDVSFDPRYWATDDGTPPTREGLNVSLDLARPPHTICEGSQTKAAVYAALPENEFSTGNRYFKLFTAGKVLAESEGFRSRLAKSITKSDEYLVATKEENVGVCGSSSCSEITTRIVDYWSEGSAFENAENEQEGRVPDDLEDDIESFANGPLHTYLKNNRDGFRNIEFEVNVQIEYEARDRTKESEDWIVSSCDYSCGPHSRSCNTCPDSSCSVSCPDCPPTHCSASSFASAPSRGGSLWTESPWRLTDGESHADPSPSINTVALLFSTPRGRMMQKTSSERPLTVRRRGSGHGTSCSGDSCYSAAENDVTQKSRRVWKINDLASRVRITVTVRDTRFKVFTRSGYVHPEFVYTYEQVQHGSPSGSPTYPSGTEYT